jgi:hypothetical protein
MAAWASNNGFSFRDDAVWTLHFWRHLLSSFIQQDLTFHHELRTGSNHIRSSECRVEHSGRAEASVPAATQILTEGLAITMEPIISAGISSLDEASILTSTLY